MGPPQDVRVVPMLRRSSLCLGAEANTGRGSLVFQSVRGTQGSWLRRAARPTNRRPDSLCSGSRSRRPGLRNPASTLPPRAVLWCYPESNQGGSRARERLVLSSLEAAIVIYPSIGTVLLQLP